jgi:hypothetical protein
MRVLDLSRFLIRSEDKKNPAIKPGTSSNESRISCKPNFPAEINAVIEISVPKMK